MQHGCVAVQVGNARGGLTIAAREGVPKEQIILGEILEPLGTHLSLQGDPAANSSTPIRAIPRSSIQR